MTPRDHASETEPRQGTYIQSFTSVISTSLARRTDSPASEPFVLR